MCFKLEEIHATTRLACERSLVSDMLKTKQNTEKRSTVNDETK